MFRNCAVLKQRHKHKNAIRLKEIVKLRWNNTIDWCSRYYDKNCHYLKKRIYQVVDIIIEEVEKYILKIISTNRIFVKKDKPKQLLQKLAN